MKQGGGAIRISDIPVSLFAAVLGISGLGLAWRKSAPMLGVVPWIGEVIIFAGVLVFAWIAAGYGLKIARAPQAMRAEANDMKQVAFFATVPLSLQLMAAGALPLDETIALLLWTIGTAAQFFFIADHSDRLDAGRPSAPDISTFGFFTFGRPFARPGDRLSAWLYRNKLDDVFAGTAALAVLSGDAV